MCGLFGALPEFWLVLAWLDMAWHGLVWCGGVGGGGRRNGGVPAIEAYDLGPARLAVGGSCSLLGAWLWAGGGAIGVVAGGV